MGIRGIGKAYMVMSILLMIGGCAWLAGEAKPEWLLFPERLYPAEKFLTGIGEGKTRHLAEQRAYAAVARIFSAHVQVQSMDRETYAIQEIGKTHRTQRTLQLDHQTDVSTTKVLENVKVLETWYQPSTQQFFTIAGLDRQQAEQIILDRLRDVDLTIENFLEQGRTHPQKVQRIHGYKQGIALLHDRGQLIADLRVIQVNGETPPPPYRLPSLQREFQDFIARDLVISVSMKGEYQEEMERAIWEGLKEEGLLSGSAMGKTEGGNRTEDVAIVGESQLWTIDLPDPLFTYVRWCGDIDIYEHPSHQLIGVISETGREGHITEQEARVRAAGAMQEALSREVARVLTQSVFQVSNAEAHSQRTSHACPQQ